ncbi:glutamate-gated chloride channel-like isoform X1 [Homarus americanus]|nr:glutamate-gated chloride channel-like isoform X1 [Homarus americanus]XP_042229951.1 glutamate-gated chloride channel-like isoform X1 [Homarus americanus]
MWMVGGAMGVIGGVVAGGGGRAGRRGRGGGGGGGGAGDIGTRRLLLLVFILLSSCCGLAVGSDGSEISSANFRAREKQIIDEIIGPANYDKRIRPAGANDTGPAIVHINIMIRNVQTISDVKMEYSIQITFREQWVDHRLTFDDMGGRIQYLTLTETDMVWMPDLFFKNEKEGHFHKIILPNLYIRIYPNGGVLYSIRISLTLSCPMNLKLFPLDRQQCQLLMASYGWTTEDLVFLWKDVDPVQVTKNLHLPRFTLEKFITDYCNSKTNTGEYSCLRVDLVFKREFSYYLIQYYIPCCMLVIVSWVSFWLDQNAVPARVSLGVTTLLTMSTQTSSINSTLPPVSYTKAIDVWTGVCLTFVFGALLEFALVNYASRSDKHREKMKEKLEEQKKQWEADHAAALQIAMQEQTEDGHTFAMPASPPRPRRFMDLLIAKTRPLVSRNGGMGAENVTCEIHLQAPRQNCCRTWLSKFPTRSKRIDVISRITFPLVFAFFNMIYWSTYLFTEEDDDNGK